MVDLFCGAAREVLADLDAVAEFGALIEAEPGLCRYLSERELDAALEAVAHLAATAAGLCGLPDWEIATLRRAALVHDVGMHGVPASIARGASTRQVAHTLGITVKTAGTHIERIYPCARIRSAGARQDQRPSTWPPAAATAWRPGTLP